MEFLNVVILPIQTLLLIMVLLLKSGYGDKVVYESYQKTAICVTSNPIEYPTSVEQLQNIIRQAKESDKTVKVIGSLHSVTDIICTSGIPISLRNLKQDMVINPKENTVTVGAGEELLTVLRFLHKHERTLIHVPSSSGITVGGAIATGAHGSTLLHSTSISEQVVSLVIVDGKGDIRAINEPDDLKAFRVHLGLLGATVTVTLQTVSSFKMRIHNYPVDESVLFNGTALNMARNRDWFQVAWFPGAGGVVFSEGNHTSAETEGTAVTNFTPDLPSANIEIARLAFEAMQKTNNFPAQYAFEEYSKLSLYRNVYVLKPPIFTETDKNGNKILVNPPVGWTHLLQSNNCTDKCAWDNGKDSSLLLSDNLIEVKMERLPEVVKRIKEILQQIPAAFVLVGILIRFARKFDGLLAMSADGDTIAIELTTPRRTHPFVDPRSGLAAYQAILDALIKEFDGRPHWGKNGLKFSSVKIIEKIPDERRQAFYAVMNKYDPYGLFMNNFGKRVCLLEDAYTLPNGVDEILHCALEDFCTCDENVDCANDIVNNQVCDICTFGKYNVCRDTIPTVSPVVCGEPGIGYDPTNFTDIIRCFLPEVYNLLGKAPEIVDDLTDGIL